MAKRKVPPSRKRYEEEHPSLTVRVPAAVKARVAELAWAEGLSVSEWVQAAAAGHEADPAEAYRKGQDVGRQEGDAAGYSRGRAQGEAVAVQAGFRSGLLTFSFATAHGRTYHAATVAEHLANDPEQRAIAERLIPSAYRSDWARLLRSTARGRG